MKNFFKSFFAILIIVLIATFAVSCGQNGDKDKDAAPPGENDVPDAPKPNTPDVPDLTEHIHVFDEWEIVTKATCLTDGVKKRTCFCGKTETATIAALFPLGHDFASTFTIDVEPTCTEKGSKSKHCLRCDEKSEITELPANGHKIIKHTAKTPTCTAIGWDNYNTCANCDYTTYVEKPASGHDFVDYVCTRCKKENGKVSYSYIEDSNSYAVTGYSGELIEAAISDTYDDGINGTRRVTKIGSGAFRGCSSLTKITIPYGITTIEESSFYGCSSLPDIVLPDSVTSIGEKAFSLCASFTDVTLPEKVTNIDDYAFSDCSSLTSVTIPDSVTNIGSSVFYGCPIKTTVIPVIAIASVRSNSLTNVTVTSGKKIPDHAFFNCSSLNLVTISDGVTGIGERAFYGCGSLLGISFGQGVQTIDAEAFSRCVSLTDVSFPDSVTNIGDWSFSYCSSLFRITTGKNVKNIGQYAFNGCSSLTVTTLGGNVTNIGEYAFFDCYKLVEVYNKSSLDVKAKSRDNGFVGYYAKAIYTKEYTSKLSVDENGYIVYTDGKDKILIGYTGTKTEISLPKKITEIYQYAFYENSKITKVTIPDDVKNIGERAFYNCSSLSNITVSDKNANYKSIKGNLYTKNCKTLIQYAIGKTDTAFTVPDIVTDIGESAFYGCTTLNNVTIAKSVTNIGIWAFGGCSSITGITIPNSVKNIGFRAFEYCSSLTIYCETAHQPKGWNSDWNPSGRPVVWDVKKDQ